MRSPIKSKEIKKSPKLGDFKTKIKFAFFPTQINNVVIWFERYIQIMRFEEVDLIEEIEISSGLIEDISTTIGITNTRTRIIRSSNKLWINHSKKLINEL